MTRALGSRDEGEAHGASGLTSRPVEPLLDVDGVAARLNITVRHVRRLVAERRIPYLKLGNLLRFDPEEVDAWLLGLHRPARRSG